MIDGEGDQDNGNFEISTEGHLSTKVKFDYEAKKLHHVRLRVADIKGAFAESKFTISVTNDIWDDAGLVGQLDNDKDGLTNSQEAVLKTDPNNPDTDGDGWIDGDEYYANSDPLRKDTDGDGLSDYEEFRYGTDPRKSDTDGDEVSDLIEIAKGTLPEDRYSYPKQTYEKIQTAIPIHRQ